VQRILCRDGKPARSGARVVQCRDADLLVSEAMNKGMVKAMEDIYRELGETDQATILFDIQVYHMDVSDVGALAEEANVQRLALNHLAPKPQGRLQANRLYRDPIRELHTGEVSVGEDGMQIVIPVP